METHLTAVKMEVPTPPHVYWAWCETCHRQIGPEVDHQLTAQDWCDAHTANPDLPDDALLLPIRRFL